MRGRAQGMLEDRDTIIEQLEAQLRTLGQQPARLVGSGGTAHLGVRTAAAGQGAAGRAGGFPWGSAMSSTSVSPSQQVGGPGLLYAGGSGSHSHAAAGTLAHSSSVGLTSPAFSGKFSGGLLSGSPKGSPRAYAAPGVGQLLAPTSRGHSRSSSAQMQQQQQLGPSPLSGSFNRRASDGAEALGSAVGEAAAAAGAAGAAGGLGSKRSSSSSALQQAAAAAAAAEPVPAADADALPLSTLRLEPQGSGAPAVGRLQVLPLPGGSPSPGAAAAAGGGGGGSGPDLASTAEDLEGLEPEDLKQRVLQAEGEMREWRAAIDSAHARINELHDETHHLQSLYQITERDAKYLREVLVSALKGGELHASSSMLQGLARMLHFTPAELEKITAHSRSSGSSSMVGSLAGWGLPNFGGLTSPSPNTGSRLF